MIFLNSYQGSISRQTRDQIYDNSEPIMQDAHYIISLVILVQTYLFDYQLANYLHVALMFVL